MDSDIGGILENLWGGTRRKIVCLCAVSDTKIF